MRRILLGALFAAASFNALADAPGGAGCGRGNILFKGQRGVATYVVTATISGTSGNNTFGITTGTGGHHANDTLPYGSKPLPVLGSMMGGLSENMAKGNGEALTTYAVMLGVQLQDREHFAVVIHERFSEIFNKSDATAADVYANTQAILKQDVRLAKHAKQA